MAAILSRPIRRCLTSAPHRRGGLLMIRLAFIALAAALWISSLAHAQQQTPIERGTYLMQSIVACGNCHTQNTPQGPRPGMELAGGTKFEEPFGVAYASNITPDAETG